MTVLCISYSSNLLNNFSHSIVLKTRFRTKKTLTTIFPSSIFFKIVEIRVELDFSPHNHQFAHALNFPLLLSVIVLNSMILAVTLFSKVDYWDGNELSFKSFDAIPISIDIFIKINKR